MPAKKLTDKQRLDWLIKASNKGGGVWQNGMAGSDAWAATEDAVVVNGAPLVYGRGPRAAIDAAMRAEAKARGAKK